MALRTLLPIGEPFSMVGCDIYGPLTESTDGYKYVASFMCYFTKYPEVVPLRDCKARTVLLALNRAVISRHGCPRLLVTDQGSCYTAAAFRDVVQSWGTSIHYTIAYHHDSNGLIERWHRTFKQMMQMTVGRAVPTWQDDVDTVCCAFRTTVNDTTAQTPNYMLYGRDINLPAECALNPQSKLMTVGERTKTMNAWMIECYANATLRIEASQMAYKKSFDRAVSKRKHVIALGDLVWVRSLVHLRAIAMADKWYPKYDRVCRVTKLDGYRVTVRALNKPAGKDRDVHMQMVKKFLGTEEQYAAYLRSRDHDGDADFGGECCYVCGEMYVNGNSAIPQSWACCDTEYAPDRWFHAECLGDLPFPGEDEAFFCQECLDLYGVSH